MFFNSLYNSRITYSINIGHDQLLGDVLSFAGGFTQSLSLVMEEFIIKGQLSVVEYMAMLGFGGAIVTSTQLLVLRMLHIYVAVI